MHLSSLPPHQDLALDDPQARTLLGPLYDMVGTWTNAPGEGWNLIAVPGPLKKDREATFFDSNHGFILETIPYIETTTYKPISVTLNRGQFKFNARNIAGLEDPEENSQEIQQIGALLYEQRIKSAGVVPSNNKHKEEIEKFFENRGFSKDQPLHAEQGMLLNIQNFNSYGSEKLPLVRMGTIPHGNVIMCMGNSKNQPSPSIDSDERSALPTPVDPNRVLPLDYEINTYSPPGHSPENYPFHPLFNPMFPNATLAAANKNLTIDKTVHISLSTEKGTGGLLSIPFVGGGFDGIKLSTTKMIVDYWISNYIDADGKPQVRLQYSQNINIVFPSTDNPTLPINWPHIGLNTMYKVD